MIRHIVLIRFKPSLSEAEIAALFTELGQIRSQLPGFLAITAGRSESPEQMERGYMHGFVIDFADWDALQAYQDHPDHQAVGAKLVQAALGGKEGILCFDLDVQAQTS
jgi:hypothetical protein